MEKRFLKKRNNRVKRHRRVRAKIYGSNEKPRLAVYRSNRGINLQLIDDDSQKTLFSVSSDGDVVELKTIKGKKTDFKGKSLDAYKVGLLLGEKAKKKSIKECVFDKGGFKYHGRVAAVAEGVRESGVKI